MIMDNNDQSISYNDHMIKDQSYIDILMHHMIRGMMMMQYDQEYVLVQQQIGWGIPYPYACIYAPVYAPIYRPLCPLS